MNASLLAVLNDTERLLVAETERASLAALDEDAAIELESRIRRARNKYVGQYRRAASAAVAGHGGRGKARPENTTARMKAEAFEEALSRVSRRVAALAAVLWALSRAELAREFDRVLVFADGHLVEEGKFEELEHAGNALTQLVA